ncbi:cGAMP-activated phospholipase CapV [Acinetobacter bereziniae]|uniref:CBASS cGAMP-activated phospholipase n=1 Tax=Acinetobacter bereziniae TaxID=106648 RepID=UPI0021CD720E|nr:CBASS cGAMP-activated phospholipase [Acinetobacter bereziniae]MCU4539262.1 cGAMP-activated phospholipase CapV [Acinetobacter bereziniae]
MNSDNNQNIVKILSLNGGGVRGLFTISFLAEIERIIELQSGTENVKIGDYFDLITGTSIGGILALGLASGRSARELELVFQKNASKIFPTFRYLIKKFLLPFSPIYKSAPLRETITSMIDENQVFNDLNRRVMIPTVNLSSGNPFFFKTPHDPFFTRDGVIKLIDAALATSAAPTYFSPHYCADKEAYFADGGLVANNPSFIGLKEVLHNMKSDFPNTKIEDIKILNVGTLNEHYCLRPKLLGKKCHKGYLGLWGTGERLVLSTMTANQNLHRFMLIREFRPYGLDKINLIEIDGTIPNEASKDITLDNASSDSLKHLTGTGKQIATEKFAQEENLREFFKDKVKPFKRVNQ